MLKSVYKNVGVNSFMNRRFDDKKLGWLRAGKEFALFIIIAFFVFRFIVGISQVSGNSMQTTFEDGQIVVFSRMHRKQFERGDIVSVRMPSGEYLIKRVIAVAGDTVELYDGIVYINGKAEEAEYVNGKTMPQGDSVQYPVEIREGQIFVMGDNREVSIDSRTIGPVSATQTRGKIIQLKKHY